MFKRILVASDLTDQSATALKFASRMADDTGASVTAVHVIAMPATLKTWGAPMFRADLRPYRQMLERQLEASRAALEKQAKGAGLDAESTRFVVRAGTTATSIASVAEDVGADLIIVGRGRGGRLGPVAEYTVRLAGRAVLVAPVKRSPRARRPLPVSTRRLGQIRA